MATATDSDAAKQAIHEHMAKIGRKGVRVLHEKIIERAENGEPDPVDETLAESEKTVRKSKSRTRKG